jgi:hypothetical protein
MTPKVLGAWNLYRETLNRHEQLAALLRRGVVPGTCTVRLSTDGSISWYCFAAFHADGPCPELFRELARALRQEAAAQGRRTPTRPTPQDGPEASDIVERVRQLLTSALA